VWFFGPEPRGVYAVLNAVAVLIIACPCMHSTRLCGFHVAKARPAPGRAGNLLGLVFSCSKLLFRNLRGRPGCPKCILCPHSSGGTDICTRIHRFLHCRSDSRGASMNKHVRRSRNCSRPS
jgi:hypothetical protein